MKIRQKISYHALVKHVTVSELLLEKILESYKVLSSENITLRKPRALEQIDKELYEKVVRPDFEAGFMKLILKIR